MANLGLETGTGPSEEEMDLEKPFELRWCAGKFSIGYDEGRNLFLLKTKKFHPKPKNVDKNNPRSLLKKKPNNMRIWTTRDQIFALSRHGTAISKQSRPTSARCPTPPPTTTTNHPHQHPRIPNKTPLPPKR